MRSGMAMDTAVLQADFIKIRFFFLQFTAAPDDHEPHLRYGYEEVVIPNHLGTLRKSSSSPRIAMRDARRGVRSRASTSNPR